MTNQEIISLMNSGVDFQVIAAAMNSVQPVHPVAPVEADTTAAPVEAPAPAPIAENTAPIVPESANTPGHPGYDFSALNSNISRLIDTIQATNRLHGGAGGINSLNIDDITKGLIAGPNNNTGGK